MSQTKLRPYLPYRATDGGIHRRTTPVAYASAMAWLGEPMSDSQAARYETYRTRIIEESLPRTLLPLGFRILFNCLGQIKKEIGE